MIKFIKSIIDFITNKHGCDMPGCWSRKTKNWVEIDGEIYNFCEKHSQNIKWKKNKSGKSFPYYDPK